jgi:ketosteroid isomerase-like protein
MTAETDSFSVRGSVRTAFSAAFCHQAHIMLCLSLFRWPCEQAHAPTRVSRLQLVADGAGPLKKHSRLAQVRLALAAAVESEEYTQAARLRDEMTTLSLDEEVAVLSANTNFYTAFSAGDFKAMAELWHDGEGGECVGCAHPGHPMIMGRSAVLETWKEIFNGPPISIAADVDCCRLLKGGQSAMVLCKEKVGDGGSLMATNLFEKCEDGAWRLVLHQAGPIGMP